MLDLWFMIYDFYMIRGMDEGVWHVDKRLWYKHSQLYLHLAPPLRAAISTAVCCVHVPQYICGAACMCCRAACDCSTG